MIRVTLREGLEGRYSIEIYERKKVSYATDYFDAPYAIGFLNGVISGLELLGRDFEIRLRTRTTAQSSQKGIVFLQEFLEQQ